MILKQPIEINGLVINELDISKEKFTAGIIIDSERDFLLAGGVFPTGQIEESKAYMLMIASKITGHRYEDVNHPPLKIYDF